MLLFYLMLPAIGLMLPAIDLSRFPDPSSLPQPASSSTFRGCLMDGGQPRDDSMPIDNTAQASQDGLSFPLPDCESQPRNDPMPIDDASQGGLSFSLPSKPDMFSGHAIHGGQLTSGDPMLTDHAFPMFNGGSSFPSHASPTALNPPGLGHEAGPIPMSVDDAEPNCNGM